MFGEGTYYPCEPPEFGPADLTVNDVPRPGLDGLRVGRETKQGRTLTFQIGVLGHGNGRPATDVLFDRLAVLEREWNFEGVDGMYQLRAFPQLVQPLSYKRGGVTRRVYGRPRRFAPVFPDTMAQWIEVTCDYQTIDHYSYSETVYYTTVGTVAVTKAGLRTPIRTPIRLVDTSSPINPNPIQVGGTAPAWLRFYIFGPISQPKIEVGTAFKIELGIDIKYDEWVLIDPSPWGQLVRRGTDAANLAGYLSWETPRLSQMKVAPGSYRIKLGGHDPSGTAFVFIDWRNVYHAF